MIKRMFKTATLAVLAAALTPSLAPAGESAPAVPIPAQIGLGNIEGAIPLQPGRPLRVEKLIVRDCRVVRGFLHAPVDGRLDTRHYAGGVKEYPDFGGDGVHYEYNKGDGIHVWLADRDGFDAVLVRGGYLGKLFRDTDALDGPGAGALLTAVESRDNVFRKSFASRIATDHLSFYQGDGAREGKLADVSFFRLHAVLDAPNAGDSAAWAVGGAATPDPKTQEWLAFRFGGGQSARQLREGSGQDLSLAAGQFTHLLTPAQDWRKGVTAVALSFTLPAVPRPALLTVRVQDPLDPRRELMGVDFAVSAAGDYEVTLDMPDQVFLTPVEAGGPKPVLSEPIAPSPHLWLSVASDAALVLRAPKVTLFRVPREAALPQALAWRLFLLKGEFYAMSEPHPWSYVPGNVPDVRAAINDPKGRAYRYRMGAESVLETLEACKSLAPDHDIVRQYYEWVYARRVKPADWRPAIEAAPGAPRWAVLARAALRAASAVPRWWIENRMAPTGELGGWVGDDTDLYQTWATFPLMEDAPLGAQLRDGAARLSELALATHLERGINKRRTDSLHAYEEGTNHLSLCSWWFYGDPVHFERVMEAARSVPKLTVPGPGGKRWFFSQYFGAPDLEKPGALDDNGTKLAGLDGASNPLFLHPVFEVAWYNANPGATQFLCDWADNWIGLQQPGQWLGTMELATGKAGKAYSRPGQIAYGGMVSGWMGAYLATRDTRFLRVFEMALANPMPNLHKEPYLRDLATDPGFARNRDALLASQAMLAGYTKFLLTGDKAVLEHDLEEVLTQYQRFAHMYTAAEPFTDRVYTEHDVVAYCYLGAFTTRNSWAQNHAVSYEGLGGDFAALVYRATPDHLKVALYNFAETPLKGRVRVWRLDHGAYAVKTGPDLDDNGVLDSVETERVAGLARFSPIEVTLPPRRLTLLECSQKERLDDIRLRADLAVSPLDTRREAGGSLLARVHNIGGAAATAVRVALVRGQTKVAEQTIDRVEAPLDLLPRVAEIRFVGAQPGDILVVDPDSGIPEITKHNNRLTIE